MPKKFTEEDLLKIQQSLATRVCDVCGGTGKTKVIPNVIIFGKVITTTISPIEQDCYKCSKKIS